MTLAGKLEAVLKRAVDDGAAPGLVAAAATPDGVAVAAAGVRGLADPAAMTGDTVFWIASLTKAVTAAAALQLVERGVLDLDAPVGALLPALAAPQVLTGFDADGAPQTRPARGEITLRRLLTHTSGLAYDFFSADLGRYLAATGGSLMGAEAPRIPLLFDPGEGWQYGIGIDWAGKLIEAASGEAFGDYLQANVLDPLGMADTTFFPGEALAGRRARMQARTPDGGLAPMEFAMPTTPHFGMGGGGLYSTAGDYLRFLQAVIGDGTPILGAQANALLRTNQVGDLEAGVLKSAQAHLSNDFDPFPGMAKRWSLGFVINTEAGPCGRSAGALAWGGLANCYAWADPDRRTAGVFLAQVLPFGDARLLSAFAGVERAVYGR